MHFKNSIKKILIGTLLLNLAEPIFAQPTSLGKPRLVKLSKKQLKLDEINRNCVKRNNYSAEERLKFFPFNQATQIKLVSFTGTLEKLINNNFTIINDSVSNSEIREIVTLQTQQIDSLTDILYNVGYRGRFYTIVENKCYIPRNAVLFFNSSGSVIGFIEICFECMGNRISSEKIATGDFCQQKYDLLKAFFRKSGIMY